ncbi:hypothetical protein JXA85_04885 [Candidatus Woesearchaeota archaeon]|nr:hypothetical protein [Candidatus Woesearchaeota archaeon]
MLVENGICKPKNIDREVLEISDFVIGEYKRYKRATGNDFNSSLRDYQNKSNTIDWLRLDKYVGRTIDYISETNRERYDSFNDSEKSFLKWSLLFAIHIHDVRMRTLGGREVKHAINTGKLLFGMGLPAYVVSGGMLHDTIEAKIERDLGEEYEQIKPGNKREQFMQKNLDALYDLINDAPYSYTKDAIYKDLFLKNEHLVEHLGMIIKHYIGHKDGFKSLHDFAEITLNQRCAYMGGEAKPRAVSYFREQFNVFVKSQHEKKDLVGSIAEEIYSEAAIRDVEKDLVIRYISDVLVKKFPDLVGRLTTAGNVIYTEYLQRFVDEWNFDDVESSLERKARKTLDKIIERKLQLYTLVIKPADAIENTLNTEYVPLDAPEKNLFMKALYQLSKLKGGLANTLIADEDTLERIFNAEKYRYFKTCRRIFNNLVRANKEDSLYYFFPAMAIERLKFLFHEVEELLDDRFEERKFSYYSFRKWLNRISYENLISTHYFDGIRNHKGLLDWTKGILDVGFKKASSPRHSLDGRHKTRLFFKNLRILANMRKFRKRIDNVPDKNLLQGIEQQLAKITREVGNDYRIVLRTYYPSQICYNWIDGLLHEYVHPLDEKIITETTLLTVTRPETDLISPEVLKGFPEDKSRFGSEIFEGMSHSMVLNELLSIGKTEGFSQAEIQYARVFDGLLLNNPYFVYLVISGLGQLLNNSISNPDFEIHGLTEQGLSHKNMLLSSGKKRKI